jgi:hypothetical protein
MAYCTASEVNVYSGIPSTDAAMIALIPRAEAMIEEFTRRTFEARTETHYYNVPDGRELYIDDDDLLTISALTNGDGTVLTTADYYLYPRNTNPKWAIVLKQSSDYVWEDDADGNTEGVISVAGTWGYSATVPDDIKHACIRLTTYLYRQKDSSVMDSVAYQEAGILTIPKGIPQDVLDILTRYRRAC